MGDALQFVDESGIERLVGTLHDPGATPGDVLTVLAGGAIAAAPGGGGSGGVQVVTVPVSSAQILDLFNTPVVLVPGVAGNMIVVGSVGIAYLAGTIPYLDGGGGGHIWATTNYASIPTSAAFGWCQVPSTGFWDQAVSMCVPLDPVPFDPQPPTLVSDIAGQDVIIWQDTANPTLGNGTLLVTVSYFLAPTV